MRERRKGRWRFSELVAEEALAEMEETTRGATEAGPEAVSEPTVQVETCLDALASALRNWGRLAIDLPGLSASEAAGLFDAWARHVLLRTPPPGEEQTLVGARDWMGLERFVRKQRGEEHEYVVTSMDDLRQVVWVFIESFSRAVAADRVSDQRIVQQLKTLREAIKEDDTSTLRRQAAAAANLIEGVIEVRAARYAGQIERLSSRLDQLSDQLIEAREKGALDALTGIHGRAALEEHVSRVSQLGAVLGRCAILFMVDIDHFKWVNDRYGHPLGDDVLRRVARRLRVALGRRDDFLARYGGDEFVAIVRGRSHDDAVRGGERLLFAVGEVEAPSGDQVVRVSASIGAALLRQGEDAKSWIGRADRALYAAKDAGRERVVVDAEASD